VSTRKQEAIVFETRFAPKLHSDGRNKRAVLMERNVCSYQGRRREHRISNIIVDEDRLHVGQARCDSTGLDQTVESARTTPSIVTPNTSSAVQSRTLWDWLLLVGLFLGREAACPHNHRRLHLSTLLPSTSSSPEAFVTARVYSLHTVLSFSSVTRALTKPYMCVDRLRAGIR
jgi:hypothetical protein